MRRRVLHTQHAFGKINVTPLIDVVMCLIIFYLIVGKLAMDRRIALPSSAAGVTEAGPSPVTVEIVTPQSPSGRPSFIFAGRPVEEDALDELLRGAAGDAAGPRPVQIRADRDLPYSLLSPVLQSCRRAGLTSVRLMTERRQ